jgi:hypothetical protein
VGRFYRTLATPKSERGTEAPRPVLVLQLCTAYPQAAGNGSRSDRESALLGRRGAPLCLSFTTVSAFVSRAVNLDSTPVRCRPSLLRSGNSIGGVHDERSKYARFEAKKAANRNDEAEVAQTEIHRSCANKGAEPTGPRPCRFTAAAVWHMRRAVAGCASGSIGDGASWLVLSRN